MKKTLIVSICLLIIILGGLFFFFKAQLPATSSVPMTANQNAVNLLNSTVGLKDCNLYQDTATVAKSKDITKCDCLPAAGRNQCRSYMSDEMFYYQAYEQADVSICAKMSYETGRVACVKVVNDRIASLNKSGSDDLILTYLSTNNNDAAIKILENMTRTAQKTSKYLNFLAQAYAQKALTEGSEAAYIPKALAVVEKAKQIEPNNPEVYRIGGYVYEIKPDLNLAIESYDKAITLDANYISAYAGRGHTEEMQGNTVAALADYNKAASLDVGQKYIHTFSNLCRINLYLNKPEDSIKNCSIVISSNQANIEDKSNAYQILGSVYSSLQKYDEALTQFKIAETYNPDDTNLMLSFAELYLSKGDVALAEDYSRKAVALDPIRAIPYEKLATALMLDKKYDESITNALKALDLVPNDVSILQNYKADVNFRIYSTLTETYNLKGDTINKNKYQALADSLK